MPNPSATPSVLALVGLDGQQVTQLMFVEPGATSVFAEPPLWFPSNTGHKVPYRVIASINQINAPLHPTVLKTILEGRFKRLGKESPGQPGWFYVDNLDFEAALVEIANTTRVSDAARELVRELSAQAQRATYYDTQAVDLWVAAHVVWAQMGEERGPVLPAEQGALAILALMKTTGDSVSAASGELRSQFEYLKKLVSDSGSSASERLEALLQDFLGNEGPRDDAFEAYLRGMNKEYESGTFNEQIMERECGELLLLLKALFYVSNKPAPTVCHILSLDFRETLLRLAKQEHESDSLFLGWLARQLVPSLLLDPVYRKRIFGGMAVSSVVVLYISPPVFLVMSVVALLGFYSAKRRG